MRVSTRNFFQSNTNNILNKQAITSNLNEHLTEAKRVIHGADDPVAAASIQRLKQTVSVNSQYVKNIDVADTANAQEEVTLGQVVNILQRTRELLVSAGDGIYNLDNYDMVATELEALKEELIGLANTRDGQNEYIFAGYEVDTKPFQVNEFGSVDYYGDTGVRQLQVGSGVDSAINDHGFGLFMDLSTGNGSFISTTSENNTGSGVIDEGVVFDVDVSSNFTGEEYSIHFNEPLAGTPTQYSVYSIEEGVVAGNASVKLAAIDQNDPSLVNVDPADVYPSLTSEVTLEFVATAAPGEFEIQINGQSSLPAIYDANIATAQQISIDGMNVEIQGIPAATDTYQINKYIAPTEYNENQTIEFNGVRTAIKGEVLDRDYFTLSPSTNTDMFATIQTAIDSLRIPGKTDTQEALRLTQLNMAQLQLDNALNNVVNIRSKVGARMQTLENQSQISQDFKLVSQKAMSKLEDLDMAQAISDLKREQTSLEAAQQTFVQLQSLNLFDLIR